MVGVYGRANRRVGEDVYGMVAESERNDVATELPAQVKYFDAKKQQVTLTVLHKPVFNGQEVDFPDLLEVPVDLHRGGGFVMSLPIKEGDTGMVRFGSRDQDNFQTSGEAKAANTRRFHSFSDGRFVPGASPDNKAMTDYDADNFFFGTDDHKNGVRVTPQGTVAIEGAGESALQIMEDLLTILETSSDIEGPGFTPGVRAAIAAVKARLAKMKFR